MTIYGVQKFDEVNCFPSLNEIIDQLIPLDATDESEEEVNDARLNNIIEKKISFKIDGIPLESEILSKENIASVSINENKWTDQSSPLHVQKWSKLRTALNVSMIAKQKIPKEENQPKPERRDSFLEKFSNFRSQPCMNELNNLDKIKQPNDLINTPCKYSLIGLSNNKYDCHRNSNPIETESVIIMKSFKKEMPSSKLFFTTEEEDKNLKISNPFDCCFETRRFKRFPISEKFTFLIEKNLDSLESAENLANDCEIQTKPVFFMWDPQGFQFLLWLTCVSIAVLYNLWTPIARQAFREDLQDAHETIWFMLDGIADIIYFLDILVQFRTSYLKVGLAVLNQKKLAKRYMSSEEFLLDLFSLTPIDLIQLKIGIMPMIRFPRFLKLHRAWRWKLLVENRSIFPNLWRVVNLSHILFLGCHWFAAFYFLLSKHGDFKNDWGYPDPNKHPDLNQFARKYLQSFHWATVTLTTIGDNKDSASRNLDYTHEIVKYTFERGLSENESFSEITNTYAEKCKSLRTIKRYFERLRNNESCLIHRKRSEEHQSSIV